MLGEPDGIPVWPRLAWRLLHILSVELDEHGGQLATYRLSAK
jgi:hypothetical protein